MPWPEPTMESNVEVASRCTQQTRSFSRPLSPAISTGVCPHTLWPLPSLVLVSSRRSTRFRRPASRPTLRYLAAVVRSSSRVMTRLPAGSSSRSSNASASLPWTWALSRKVAVRSSSAAVWPPRNSFYSGDPHRRCTACAIERNFQTRGSGMRSNIEENKARYRHFFAAIEAADFQVFDQIVGEDYVDHLAGQSPGRETLKQYFGGRHAAFSDLKLPISEIVAEGDKVAVLNAARGTHKGDFAGLKATGRRVDAMAFHLYPLRNCRPTQP